MQTWVDLHFADGEYSFKLGLEQIALIEKECNAGIGAIYARTLRGRWGMGDDEIIPTEAEYRFSELVQIIRLGLIGGGMESHRVNPLIRAYVTDVGDQRVAMRRTWSLAAAILASLIEGYTPPKKAQPGESPATPMKGSTSRRRSRTAP